MEIQDPNILYRDHHDWEEDGDLSSTLLDTVAEATGDDLIEFPPLYDCIDPDALDQLFTPQSGELRTDGKISFEFAGHPITIHSTGEIVLYAS